MTKCDFTYHIDNKLKQIALSSFFFLFLGFPVGLSLVAVAGTTPTRTSLNTGAGAPVECLFPVGFWFVESPALSSM